MVDIFQGKGYRKWEEKTEDEILRKAWVWGDGKTY